MTRTHQAIPTNLITGFLGSGKTTAILSLLRSRPENSHWAVLVNEFGDVGIDGAMLEKEELNDGVYIKEVPGGCLCCAAGLPLQIALNLLIQKANPDRILIEPTGVGHPKKVLDVLTGEFYKKVLDLKATICLVEAHKLKQRKYLENETFLDQLNVADVVLASKSDEATENELKQFYKFFQAFDVPKDHVASIEFGHFSIQLLDIKRNIERDVNFPDAHSHEHHKHSAHDPIADPEQKKSTDDDNYSWQKFENNGQDYYGCGWIFNHSIVFSEAKLELFVNSEAFTRVKGIFNTNKGWLLFNRSEQQLTKEESVHIADSRVEIIEPDYQDWNQVEDQLLACIYSE